LNQSGVSSNVGDKYLIALSNVVAPVDYGASPIFSGFDGTYNNKKEKLLC
jgi:hypothetical protein